MDEMMHRRFEMVDRNAPLKEGERSNKITMDTDNLFFPDGG